MIAERILGRADGGTATVTKAGLIEAVAAEAGVTKTDAEVMVNATLASMVASLQAGESIEVGGFGSFGIRYRPTAGRSTGPGESMSQVRSTQASKALEEIDALPARG